MLTPTQAIILVMKYLNGINLVEAQWHDLNNKFLKLRRFKSREVFTRRHEENLRISFKRKPKNSKSCGFWLCMGGN